MLQKQPRKIIFIAKQSLLAAKSKNGFQSFVLAIHDWKKKKKKKKKQKQTSTLIKARSTALRE